MKFFLLLISLIVSVNEFKAQSLKLRFTTADSAFVPAVKEYKQIWEEEGSKIVRVMQRLSGMKFLDTSILVIIYEAPSNSGDSVTSPMKLRASYSHDVKKATIIHELGHRLNFYIKNYPGDFNDHNFLFLYLYDVWAELYGEKFANEMVQIEYTRSNPRNDYEKMRKDALSMSKEKRKKKLQEFISGHS